MSNLIFSAALVKTEDRPDSMKNIIIEGSSKYRGCRAGYQFNILYTGDLVLQHNIHIAKT